MKKVFVLSLWCCLLTAQLLATPPFKVKKEAIAISPTEQANLEKQKLNFFQRVVLKKMQKKADKLLRKLQQGDCDIMITMNREELLVKVVEIGQGIIKYKKCNFQDGPSIVIAACDVFLIKYANGSTETPECGTELGTKKTNGLAIAAAATAGGGVLFLFLIPILGLLASIAAVVLGFISLDKIKKSKNKQKGKGWSWVAIGLGGLIVLSTVLLLIL